MHPLLRFLQRKSFSGLRGPSQPPQLFTVTTPTEPDPALPAGTYRYAGGDVYEGSWEAGKTHGAGSGPFPTRRAAAGLAGVAGPTARCPGTRACRAGGAPRAVASRSATPGAGRVTESSGRGAAGNGDGACAAQGGAASSTAASTWASTPRAGPTAAVPHPSPPSPPAGFCGPSGPGGSDPDSQRLGGTRLGPRRTRMRGA